MRMNPSGPVGVLVAGYDGPAVAEAPCPACAPRGADPCLVTGYVPLHQTNRSHGAYMALGRQFLGLGLRTHAYLDSASAALLWPLPDAVTHCDPGEPAFPVAPAPDGPRVNAGKDTADYFALQHRKSEWLAKAAADDLGDVLAWVDLGVMHVPRVGPAEIRGFFDRLPRARRDRITVPSIWGLPDATTAIRFDEPAWHFAGGVLIVPAKLAEEFHGLCLEAHDAILRESGVVAWEVNTWAVVAREYPTLFASYECDHNHTLFDHFQP